MYAFHKPTKKLEIDVHNKVELSHFFGVVACEHTTWNNNYCCNLLIKTGKGEQMKKGFSLFGEFISTANMFKIKNCSKRCRVNGNGSSFTQALNNCKVSKAASSKVSKLQNNKCFNF
jgi:hypothetical protein